MPEKFICRDCCEPMSIDDVECECGCYKIPVKVIKCDCGRSVECWSFTNTCDCGRDYNNSGQMLAPRCHWGEETGEHWSECY